MIPLIPTLALAFVSFLSSAFVILRIIIPILPPHPLSRRVRPSEFGLPNFRSLSPADKSHVWLASCDIVALAIFTWQAVNEHLNNASDYDAARDPAAAVRLWIALTLRQTCLLVVATLTLVHVRMGRPVAYGRKHWMLWAPTLLLFATSTALAGVLAATGVPSFFMGLFAYSTTIAVATTVAFACLFATLVIIRRNLAALDEIRDPWPPAKEVEEKPRPSFATEDIDALKDGSSWITSRASSRHDSISAFSFSTHHSAMPSNASARIAQNSAMASQPSIPHKSSFWFNPATPYNGRESPVPPVPPLPAPYRPSSPTSAEVNDDPDPFRRTEPRDRTGSQSSWLTEPSTYQPSLTAWSFPTTRPGTPPSASTADLHTDLLPSTAVSRLTPAMASAQVLGGYGYDPEAARSESRMGALASVPSNDLNISVYRIISWFATIWVPLALSVPYLFVVSPKGPLTSSVAPVMLVLSVTLSSPILALHLLLRSPLPIPTGLFENYNDPPSAVLRGPSPESLVPSFKFSHEYKRSGSVTVVEGRRSGDVWVTNGDAVGGKSKLGRAMGLLQPVPKLAVLPPGGDEPQEGEVTPPLPMQTENHPPTIPPTPQSENSVELGRNRTRKDSKASSYFSGGSEAYATQIMIAQRHYSTLALTMVVPPSPSSPDRPPSPERRSMDDAALRVSVTGVETSVAGASTRASQHLRSRSVSSVSAADPRFPMSPPPSSPLPPTPPSIKELRERQARLAQHRRSQSHSSSLLGFSFGPVAGDDVAEIDALSAGLLPLLVPGLKVGPDVKIREDWNSPASTFSKGTKNARTSAGSSKGSKIVPPELGGLSSEFSSPEMHSTPPMRRPAAPKEKTSAHKRHHFSLPSLSLGKDGLHTLATWRTDLNRALDSKRGQYSAVTTTEVTRRNTVWGSELVPNAATHLNAVREEDEFPRPLSPATGLSSERPASTHTFGPPSPADVPSSVNTARNSLATLITALDQELHMPRSATSDVTLFDFDNTNGPVAESTPHESQKTTSRPISQQAPPPPVPQLPAGVTATRRSSIVYIKSDENAPSKSKPSSISPKSFSEWSSRAVRPLVPKNKAKVEKQRALKLASSENGVLGSPRAGLRPLSLLQDRDVNLDAAASPQTTRALAIGKKKQKTVTDENADPSRKSKGLRPLKLARSDTTKQRALLRKDEVLPDVIVRPPSESQHTGFAYSFR
ncbi:hypothetical protein AcV5_001290 [Taiwanofungus camphoratus]|nr:hypothetical protein AcV5_001290 [Antrodia cinnamomea]